MSMAQRFFNDEIFLMAMNSLVMTCSPCFSNELGEQGAVHQSMSLGYPLVDAWKWKITGCCMGKLGEAMTYLQPWHPFFCVSWFIIIGNPLLSHCWSLHTFLQ